MLTAWGFGACSGRSSSTVMRESTGSYTSVLRIIAALMPASVALPLLIRPAPAAPGR
jgi:hypothetical protein